MNKKLLNKINEKVKSRKGEFGVSVVINTAIALIITAFILFPSIKGLATKMTDDMGSWYSNNIRSVLFEEIN